MGTVAHGATRTVSTHDTFFNGDVTLNTEGIGQGVINVESTQSGVFCTAMIVNVAATGDKVPLHLVRVNAHPGTVE